MDIRDILKSFDQLTEGDSTVHKAGPGGYGNKHGSEDVTDQYGKPIGRISLGKLGAQKDAEGKTKPGKGRPVNPDKAKEYDSTALNKAMGIGKAPKPTGKPSVKHSLTEYFDQMDNMAEGQLNELSNSLVNAVASQRYANDKGRRDYYDAGGRSSAESDEQNRNIALNQRRDARQAKDGTATGLNKVKNAVKGMFTKSIDEADAYTTAPMPGAVAVKDATGKVVATAKNPQAAAAFEKGDITLGGDEQGMAEGDVGKHNNATTGFDALVRKLTPKYGEKAAKKIAGSQLKKIGEAEAPQNYAQSSPISSNNRSDFALEEGKKGVNPFAKKDTTDKKKCPPMSHIKKMCQDGKSVAEICKMHPDCDQKELKQMVADCKKKLSEGAKPDFLDMDKDGNKKEPMKKAVADKKKGATPKKGVNPFAKKDEKQKVKEGMDHKLQSARLRGKSHALAQEAYNCHYDDMEEARCYHDGFKEGLDECYGQMPILGRTAVGEMGQGPEVDTMASYGADALGEMDKTAYMKQQAIKTPGDTFKAFGQTMHDKDVIDEFAFEALDKQLNAILEGKEVSEGMTVSISKGQQGSPDSVSVSAQDSEADQLLSIIKSAGMGLFGGDEQNGYGAPQGSTQTPGGISVVDDHDGMMALMKKLSGNSGEMSNGDYESEEGSDEGHMHGHEEETCDTCGSSPCDCDSEEMVDETQSEDQMAYEVAEANAPDSGADNTDADVAGNAATNSTLATVDAAQNMATAQTYSNNEELDEFFDNQVTVKGGSASGGSSGVSGVSSTGGTSSATGGTSSATGGTSGSSADATNTNSNSAKISENDKEDHKCEHCDCNPCECDDKEKVDEGTRFANLFRKIAMLSEESTSEKDAKAEKAGKKVAKDIEYDEGHKGKDDDKAEKAGKKVTKDIEYDDKKDKVDESYANSADDTFEADIEFMTNVISGGLNKQKSTGQTTIPVIAGQKNRMGADGLGNPMKESTDLLRDYMKLSGL